jgi:hypothetical protein
MNYVTRQAQEKCLHAGLIAERYEYVVASKQCEISKLLLNI